MLFISSQPEFQNLKSAKLKTKVNPYTMSDQNTNKPLAIVGIGCRFPGDANSASELWQLLLNGTDAIIDVPIDRWNADVFYDPTSTRSGRIRNHQGGFIKDIDKFDAEFFGIFAEEAAQLDPQQRLALEVACEALEDAGESLANASGSRTSVFLSGFLYDYLCMQMASSQRHTTSPYAGMGASLSAIANRVSYCLNLNGPSVTVDTACSGSLVSLHMACNSIWNNEADAALAGGVNALLRPESSIALSSSGFLSPDSRCKAFDISANGYVRSEGAGILYIKRLSDALEDNDELYAIIRGSAVNQDGYTAAGLTVPNRDAQVRMLKAAYADAGVEPSNTVYVEAHGPGTPVGDPIETSALGEVIGAGRDKSDKFLVGSIKTNIGHLEGASGIAGAIKASLILKNQAVPPNLHFNEPNPAIDFDKYRICVPTKVLPLKPKGSEEPIVSVNSFGAGGTNAHVVMQGAPNHDSQQEYTVPNEWIVFLISARSLSALKEYAQQYIAYLQLETKVSLEYMSLAQFTRRTRHEHQLYILARTREELIEALQAYRNDEPTTNIFYHHQEALDNPRVAFVYSGQGGQWAEMGVALLKSEPVFAETLQEFDRAFKAVSGWSVLDEIGKPKEHSRINDTTIVQPALVAIQIGLTKLLQHYGIQADGVVGHSIGEVSSAYASGATTLEQAASIIYHRARIQDQASGKGKMLAIAMSADDAHKLVEPYQDRLSIATINGPSMITLAGDEEPLQRIAQQMESKAIFNRFVNVDVPYHSHYMDPLEAELVETLGQYSASDPIVPLYSTVTTSLQDASKINGGYWYDNVRQPVRFAQTIETMIDDGFNIFIEIGPHPVLTRGISDTADAMGEKVIVASALDRSKPDSATPFFEAMTAWLSAGHTIAQDTKKSRKVGLPTYPWQHQRHWHESASHKHQRTTKQKFPFVKRVEQFVTDEHHRLWEVGVGLSTSPYLSDHRVEGTVVYPATAHLMMALAAAHDLYNHPQLFLHDIRFESALVVPDKKNANLDVRLEITDGEGSYTICSRDASADDASPWMTHSGGKINTLGDEFRSQVPDLSQLQKQFGDSDMVDIERFYQSISNAGLQYGKTFQCIQEMWVNGHQSLARLELDRSLELEADRYLIHPALLDASLHSCFAVVHKNAGTERIYLPDRIDRIKVHAPATPTIWAYINVHQLDHTWLVADCWLFDGQMSVVAELYGITSKSLSTMHIQEDIAHADCAQYRWQKESLREHGDWVELVEGELLHVVLFSEESKGLLTQIKQGIESTRPDLKIHIANTLPEIDNILDSISLDRRTHLLYIPERGAEKLMHSLNRITGNALHIMQKLIEYESIANLFFVTQNATNIEESDKHFNIAHAPLYGMARVMANEVTSLSVRLIDINPKNGKHVSTLCDELFFKYMNTMQSEIALRETGRFVRKLCLIDGDEIQQRAAQLIPASGTEYRAFFEQPGMVGDVSFRRISSQAVDENEVAIQVKAAGINYKDVMNVLGLLSERSVTGGLAGNQPGLEVSGVVTTVGRAVKDFRPGDEVIARTANGFSGQCITPASNVVSKPSAYTLEQAAALPIVYLTAHYGLNYLGRMTKGETVLIHSASGGVGIAAIQLAQAAGVHVIATAGTPKKRAFLRETYGIEHVFDSRSNSFFNDVINATNGRGVDLVLNSLTGRQITQGLKCLAPYGRFIELGKTDVYGNTALGLQNLAENISFHVVDVDRLAYQKPQLHKALFEQVIELIETQQLPAHPITQYAISELDKALREMMRSSHVGKFVVSMDDTIAVLPPAEFQIPTKGAVIITGGASGLGLRLAKWISQRGATKLVLVSRSGCKSVEDQATVDEIIANGVDVTMEYIDVNNQALIEDLIEKLHHDDDGLAGIIHAAGLLDDALIPNMTPEKFARVFNPKAIGAWHLHEACIKHQINPEIFLMISSVSSIFGLKGQVNYAAANYFQDALAEYRQGLGMSAVSINLGVLGDYAGMSKKGEDTDGVLELLTAHGLQPMREADVFAKIEAALIERPSHRLAADLRWKAFGVAYPNLVRDAKFADLFIEYEQREAGGRRHKGLGIRDEILEMDIEQAAEHVAGKLAEAISELTGMGLETVSLNDSIDRWALDSIMLGQLSTWILKNTEINYSLIKLVNGPSLHEISTELVPQLLQDHMSADSGIDEAMGTKDDGTLLLEMGAKKLSPWLIRGASVGDESKRIICFHSMGVGASLYTHFLLDPPADTDLLAIQLPGRENRSSEPTMQSADEIVENLITQLTPYLDRPYMIWGHSFGGIIAFETIRRLRADGLGTPSHLMITATMPPHLITVWQNRDMMRRLLTHENDAQYLASMVRYIENPEFFARILPTMRRDMTMLELYKYREQPRFDIPITTWTARQDDMVYQDEIEQWKQHTTKGFEINLVDGYHWFLNSNKEAISQKIESIVREF